MWPIVGFEFHHVDQYGNGLQRLRYATRLSDYRRICEKVGNIKQTGGAVKYRIILTFPRPISSARIPGWEDERFSHQKHNKIERTVNRCQSIINYHLPHSPEDESSTASIIGEIQACTGWEANVGHSIVSVHGMHDKHSHSTPPIDTASSALATSMAATSGTSPRARPPPCAPPPPPPRRPPL